MNFFEGTPKRFEIHVDGLNLLNMPVLFWQNLVARGRSQIVKEQTSPHFRSYVLAESSLIVYPTLVMMMTCGRAPLIEAASMILDELASHCRYFDFSRGREQMPEEQSTTFEEDVNTLTTKIKGIVTTGDRFRYTSETCSRAPAFEMHLYDLDPHALQESRIEMEFKLLCRSYFSECEILDHRFSPRGYSANVCGINGYATLHVTSESESPYVNFETNQRFDPQRVDQLRNQILHLVRAKGPSRFHPDTDLPQSSPA